MMDWDDFGDAPAPLKTSKQKQPQKVEQPTANLKPMARKKKPAAAVIASAAELDIITETNVTSKSSKQPKQKDNPPPTRTAAPSAPPKASKRSRAPPVAYWTVPSGSSPAEIPPSAPPTKKQKQGRANASTNPPAHQSPSPQKPVAKSRKQASKSGRRAVGDDDGHINHIASPVFERVSSIDEEAEVGGDDLVNLKKSAPPKKKNAKANLALGDASRDSRRKLSEHVEPVEDQTAVAAAAASEPRIEAQKSTAPRGKRAPKSMANSFSDDDAADPERLVPAAKPKSVSSRVFAEVAKAPSGASKKTKQVVQDSDQEVNAEEEKEEEEEDNDDEDLPIPAARNSARMSKKAQGHGNLSDTEPSHSIHTSPKLNRPKFTFKATSNMPAMLAAFESAELQKAEKTISELQKSLESLHELRETGPEKRLAEYKRVGNDRVAALEQQLAAKSSQLSLKSESLSEALLRNKTLTAQLETSVKSIADLEEKVTQLQESELNTKFQELSAMFKSSLGDVERALEERDEVLAEKDEVVSECQALEAKVAQLLKDLARTKEECDAERKAKENAEIEKREAVKEKNDAVKEKEEALTDMDDAMKERNSALEERDMALREKLDALKARDDAIQEKAAAQVELEAALAEAVKKSSDVEVSEFDAKKLLSQMEQDLEIATKEVEDLKKRGLEAEKSNAKLVVEVSNLNSKIESMQLRAEVETNNRPAQPDRYLQTLERMVRMYEELTHLKIQSVEDGKAEIDSDSDDEEQDEVEEGEYDAGSSQDEIDKARRKSMRRQSVRVTENKGGVMEDVLLHRVEQSGKNGEIHYTLAIPKAATASSSPNVLYLLHSAKDSDGRVIDESSNKLPEYLNGAMTFSRERLSDFYVKTSQWLYSN
ncbi:hypothetical protein HDU77_003486 [Chytriomyces hyalinus]|nr:hypothetical protein HDU77_003486 [Chytriomyces hyalinus]